MSQPTPQPDRPAPSGPVPRSPWIDGTLAVLVGAGFGLALYNSPTTWLIAVALLVLAAGSYAYLTFRFVRLRDRRPDPAAQRAHGVRVIALFVIAYLLTRLVPPADWRLVYALGGGLFVGVGGYVVLRREERGRARARLSARDDRIGS